MEKNVTLYHAVTLGGVSPSINSDSQRSQKRHPTLKDDVIVGSGAQILGPIIISQNAKIGANAVVLDGVTVGEWAMIGASSLVSKSVPDYGLVVGNPARLVGWVGEFGVKLLKENDFWICPETKAKYLEKDGTLSPVDKKSLGDI